MKNTGSVVNLATVMFVAATFAAGAAETSTSDAEKAARFLPWEKGSLKLGGFIAAFDSEIGFGTDAGGVTLNAEELFGLDTSLTVFRAEAMYRPGKSLRHQLDLTYASYHREGSATLKDELEIGDNTYPIGARIESEFNFDIIRGTYSYALIQDERMRLSVGLGVYAVPLEYGVEVTTESGRSVVEGADTTLPLPSLALRGDFQLIPRLFLYSGIDAMYLEVAGFKGSLVDVNVGLEYRPWKHVGFGLGYNGLSVGVEAEEDDADYPGVDFIGNVDVRFSGLMLYGKLCF